MDVHGNITRRSVLGGAALLAGSASARGACLSESLIEAYRETYAEMTAAWKQVVAAKAGPFSDGGIWDAYWDASQRFADVHARLVKSMTVV